MLKAQFLGHAGWRLSDGSHAIFIDPFLTGNPLASMKADEIDAADAILVTHAHGDHLGDAIPLAKRTEAVLAGTVEMVGYCESQGAGEGRGMNLGGSFAFPWGEIKLIQAFHTSGGAAGEIGTPCGIIGKMGGVRFYHSGDTSLFGDMELYGRLYPIDLALLPIGDYYTMGPDDALEAVRLLKPKRVVPMHYDTFPVIRQDGEAWAERVRALGIECRALKPGETWEIAA